MKTIAEHVNDAMVEMVSEATVCTKAGHDAAGAAISIRSAVTKLLEVRPQQIKRIFSKASDEQLDDYVLIIKKIASWVDGTMDAFVDGCEDIDSLDLVGDQADMSDDEINAITGLELIQYMGMSNDMIIDVVADEFDIDGNLKTVSGYDDIADVVTTVLAVWSDISKAVTGKEW